MRIKSASKSALETYSECEYKYFLNYECKITSPSGKSALIGNIVHKVMELLAVRKKLKKHKKISKLNSANFLLPIVYKSYTEKNSDIEWANADYNTCRKNIEWLLNNGFHPFDQDVISAEQNFEMEINKKGFKIGNEYFKIKGIIDLCIQEDNGETLHIIDYKTGKYVSDWATGETKTDFTKDLQLRMYYLAVQKLYPKYKKYKFSVVYSALGQVYEAIIDKKSEPNILESLRRYFVEINNNQVPLRLKDDPNRRALAWRCKKLCYYGVSGKCDSSHQIFKTSGYEKSIALINPTINSQPIKTRAGFKNLGGYFDEQ